MTSKWIALAIILTFPMSMMRSVASVSYDILHCDGKRVIVHLFEWKWKDIAAECERFLAQAGFCAVQVSPPQEHILKPENRYPWWQRYQPVSYKLHSRSGDEEEFRDMVKRCNDVGVRIIVDAVINHMTEVDESGIGSGGSFFDASNLSFPGVAFSNCNFTPRNMCPSSDGKVHNYQDPIEVRNCYLNGLTDLFQGNHWVRVKISSYLNHLIDIGVMGFRIDAAKHMWPGDLSIIQGMVKDLNTEAGFPPQSRPFFFSEVMPGSGTIKVNEYYNLGLVTEFLYCFTIAIGMKNFNELGSVYRSDWGMAIPNKAVVFVDNHDFQRYHGKSGKILTYKNGREYSNAVVYTLAQDYGIVKIMSSYYFDDIDQGPPSDGGGKTKDVIINPDGTCGNGWVCEHRWPSISRMVRFKNETVNTYKNNWYSEGDTIAFSRGNKAFFAINKKGKIDQTFQTGMSTGVYCDVITNCATNVTVNEDGTAHIVHDNYYSPFVAICEGCEEPLYL